MVKIVDICAKNPAILRKIAKKYLNTKERCRLLTFDLSLKTSEGSKGIERVRSIMGKSER